jgi:hypothetical protein
MHGVKEGLVDKIDGGAHRPIFHPVRAYVLKHSARTSVQGANHRTHVSCWVRTSQIANRQMSLEKMSLQHWFML